MGAGRGGVEAGVGGKCKYAKGGGARKENPPPKTISIPLPFFPKKGKMLGKGFPQKNPQTGPFLILFRGQKMIGM